MPLFLLQFKRILPYFVLFQPYHLINRLAHVPDCLFLMALYIDGGPSAVLLPEVPMPDESAPVLIHYLARPMVFIILVGALMP